MVTTEFEVIYTDWNSQKFRKVHPDSISVNDGILTFEIDDADMDIWYIPLSNVRSVRSYTVG